MGTGWRSRRRGGWGGWECRWSGGGMKEERKGWATKVRCGDELKL